MSKHEYFKQVEAVMESDLPANARLVYLVVAKRYNVAAKREANPSHQRIASDTGLSISSIKRAVTVLVETGWFTVTYVKGKSSGYTPHIGGCYLGHSDLGVGQGDLGGRSQRPTNDEVNDEENDEVRQTAPTGPVATADASTTPFVNTKQVDDSVRELIMRREKQRRFERQ